MNKAIQSAFKGKSVIEDGTVCLCSGVSYRGKISLVDVNGEVLSDRSFTDPHALHVVPRPGDVADNPLFVMIDLDAIVSIVVYPFRISVHLPEISE